MTVLDSYFRGRTMKSKFSAIMALALTAMLLVAPIVGGGGDRMQLAQLTNTLKI